MKSFALRLIVISILLVLVKGHSGNSSPKKIVCYRYDLEYYKENYNDNCTHVIFRVGKIDPKTAKIKATHLYNLKKYQSAFPNLKLILGLDPFDTSKSDLPEVINSEVGRKRLINSIVAFIKEKGYNGIDLAFQHKFVHQTAIVASGIRKMIGRNGTTLSGLFLRNVAREDFHHRELSEIAEDLDFMTLECYEISKRTPYTELAAPLYAKDKKSVSQSIKWFLKMGAPRKKLLMGIQTYAVTHTLDNVDDNSVGSPAKDPGWLVPPGHSHGILQLFQISEPLWTFDRDKKSQAPFASNYFQWASFEDNISISAKVRFARKKGLSGIALTTSEWNDQADKQLPFVKYVSELLSNEEKDSFSEEDID